MAKDYSYADAIRLLGGEDPTVKNINLLLGIGTLGLWGVIDAQQQFVQVGSDLLGRWREWRSDHKWRSRTERIEAAHTILVITAFFEAMDSIDLPFTAKDLEMSREEQEALARRSGLDFSRSPACPSPHLPFEKAKKVIFGFYEAYGKRLLMFASGLDVWEILQPFQREKATVQLEHALPKAAIARYEDRYRQLAIDVPEFRFWAGMIENQATREGQAELEQLLSLVTSGAALPNELTDLAQQQRALLKELVGETEARDGEGMTLPTIEEAYVPARFRVREVVDHRDDPSTEAWWADLDVCENLPHFLAGYLTQSAASKVPFVILGQPGAGKSLLTKMVAAWLLEDRCLPVRVPLREVSSDADLQQQIEEAIYKLTGNRLEWRALAMGAGGALPVVLLDGFDELLQATGVRQSAFLEKVARFQKREADAGRAVAFIVTSRTAVADRARFVPGTMVARLEPFNEEQIAQWLTAWNAKNGVYFKEKNVEPFTLEVALSQPALSEQPLLLLMLALYDAGGNALRMDAAELGQAELYDRLMQSFIERELTKTYPDGDVPAWRLEQEMLHLSYVAFAMFNRGHQWVTTDELNEDLSGLQLPVQVRSDTSATPLTPGELAFAKFFFVHHAEATRDDGVLRTYEFMHATFGEYLIARLIAELLGEMAAKASGLILTGIDDELLQALLSWATLSSRATVVSFLQELAVMKGAADLWRGLVMRLFRQLDTRLSMQYANYRPSRADSPRRHAYYTANLLVLALACAPAMRASAVLPGREDVVTEWRRQALLWRSQCAAEELSLIREN